MVKPSVVRYVRVLSGASKAHNIRVKYNVLCVLTAATNENVVCVKHIFLYEVVHISPLN